MSIKSLIIYIIFFIFYFCKYLFCCIRTTVSDNYISNPVYYGINFHLENNRSLQTLLNTAQKKKKKRTFLGK